MDLHEYQSKNLFAQFNIPTPKGKIATSPQEAYDIAKEFGRPVVIKAQVLTGGRGKEGGIRLARTPDQAREMAEAILGMQIKGLVVHKVLVDPSADIAQELYLGISNDRIARKPLMMASAGTNVDIEQISRDRPERIIREHIDPFIGLRDYQARNLAIGIELPREVWKSFTEIAHNLYRCFHDCDATLAEITPLALNSAGQLVALDGKISLDDSALFRHTDLAEMRDWQAEPFEEMRAREAGLSYVKLSGDIGCMVNGAGLAMTMMDITKDIAARHGLSGSGPANFLDIGGGARADKVAAGLRIILADPKVKVVLLNIFGGLTRCDEVARGVLQAVHEVKVSLPMIIRLAGTNAQEGRQIIDAANLPNVYSASTLIEAAEKAVLAARNTQRHPES